MSQVPKPVNGNRSWDRSLVYRIPETVLLTTVLEHEVQCDRLTVIKNHKSENQNL